MINKIREKLTQESARFEQSEEALVCFSKVFDRELTWKICKLFAKSQFITKHKNNREKGTST